MSDRRPAWRGRLALVAGLGLLTAPASAQDAEAERFDPTVFEIVRTAPGGPAMLVGEAEPGATVELLDGDEVAATAEANERGEWVVVVPDAIAARLRLRTTSADGRFQYLAEQAIDLAMAMPPAVAADDTATASDNAHIWTPWAGPDGAEPAGAAPPALADLAVDVDADMGAGVTVEPVVAAPMIATLAVETATDLGAGVAVEGALDGPIRVTVQPGDTLWELAERYLGGGVFFDEIVAANPETIANPGRLRAGVVLIMPAARIR